MNARSFLQIKNTLLILALATLGTAAVKGMPASPAGFFEEQPDGSTVHLHLEGDEFFHRLTDTKGFTQ